MSLLPPCEDTAKGAVFETENGDEYKVGIGNLDVENTTDDVENIFAGIEDELQYLAKWSKDKDEYIFQDVQDPDVMEYEGIDEMLKKYCNINENSKIYLYDDEFNSFNGEEESIFWDNCTEEVKYKELNHPCRKCQNDKCEKCKMLELFYKEVKEKYGE